MPRPVITSPQRNTRNDLGGEFISTVNYDYARRISRKLSAPIEKVAIQRRLQSVVASRWGKRCWPTGAQDQARAVTRVSLRATQKGPTRSGRRSAWISRRSFQRNPHDFRAHSARAKGARGDRSEGFLFWNQTASDEQTSEKSRWFFRAYGDDCLEHIVATWTLAGAIRPVECVPMAFIRSARRDVEQPDADHGRTVRRNPGAQGFPRAVSIRGSCGSRSGRYLAA